MNVEGMPEDGKRGTADPIALANLRRFGGFPPIPELYIWQRYSVAVGCGVLAILLRAVLEPLVGHTAFYVTVYVAVLFSALVCGAGAATVTAVLGTVGVVYWFVDPRHTVMIADKPDLHGLLACIFVSAAFIALGHTNRQKRLQLNDAREQLEERVRERTSDLALALRKRESAEEESRRLSVRLMQVQDEERRHIARELHDSAGQTLTALKMSLARLKTELRTQQGMSLAEDVQALTDEALQEIRTTSYLLHPPMLDECGLVSAAQWFVDGFSKRSGIEVQCNLPGDMQRLPPDVELVLFRVLQESLTNIHRHSGATVTTVSLSDGADVISFEISDNGRGIAQNYLKTFHEEYCGSGVGLRGMRERVRELGGEMSIRSDSPGGTTLSFKIARTRALAATGSQKVSAA